ncbi:integrase/recombinase XerD [Geodermatophilus amargosae]|uniref:Tyrosine recombinase XerD n=1 Tax=Geodermatophilus amargosae TaxID=1296565 RepID=A0A1I6Z759_9ACTN|nr:site-specific tyrosine recombinase XerD [Geodermatophilus amargosae]SFT58560.1 integrase/recombinase XerD [Geodermatophilus amargosae]
MTLTGTVPGTLPGTSAPGPDVERVVGGYLDHLAVERGLAANTITSYRRDLRRYTRFLADAGVRGLGEVAESDVTGFLAALRQGDDEHPPLSATSAARAVVAVRGLHRFALLDGLVPGDVAAEVRPPAPARRLPKAIPVEAVVALIEAAGSLEGPRGLRDRALLEVLYGTGARISEAVGLAVDDLDRGQAVVRLAGKGGKERIVPVGSYALRAVEDYLVRARPALAMAGTRAGRGGVRGGRLFLNARGGPLSRQSAWTILQTAGERAGGAAGLSVDHVSPHTLRHSFATHLLDGGADVRVVQELLGHASVTTTQVYTLVTVDKLREVYASSHPRALS